jgi:hypothetical protein
MPIELCGRGFRPAETSMLARELAKIITVGPGR